MPAAAWIRAEQLEWYMDTLGDLGRIQEADDVSLELETLASRIGHSPALSSCRRRSAWSQFWKQPDLAQLQDKFRGDFDAQTKLGLSQFFVSAAHLSTAEFLAGKWDEALHRAESAWTFEAPRRFKAMNLAVRFRLMACMDNRQGALALLNDHRELVARRGQTNIYGSWMLLLAAIEGLFLLGEREQAAVLYPDVQELILTGEICIHSISRFPQTAAGIAAIAARNWDTAENHFRIAMQQAESYPNVVEQADIRRFHAMMLLNRAAPDDREKAQTLLREALETYTRIGMARHIKMIQTLFARCR
jgi:tetratricopeptide (TPR) repeat protein